MTFLRRIGNKKKYAERIISYFPTDITVFIDLFFGTGAMTWEMMKTHPNIYYKANDFDGDVYNIWKLTQDENKMNELIELLNMTPMHPFVFKYLKESEPSDDVKKALRFLWISNFSLFGFGGSIALGAHKNDKLNALINIGIFMKKYSNSNIMYTNSDFRDVVLPFPYPEDRLNQLRGQFVYCDPPYINTADNYSNSFTEKDTRDLIEKMISSELRFCISEFKTDITVGLAKEYGLHITEIAEKRNVVGKTRPTEIIMTNYVATKNKIKTSGLFNI